MSRSGGVRVGYATWAQDPDANSATPPTNADHGVAVGLERQAKDVHVVLGKSNACDMEVWGYPQADPGWVIVDRIEFSEETSEGQRYEALTAYQRVAVRRMDTNVQDTNAVNAFVGCSEH